MEFKHRMIVFDAADIEAESSFWAGFLGGAVQGGAEWRNIWIKGDWQIGVQLAPQHVAPGWPDGDPQQMHLDFYISGVEDLDATHDKITSLGGTVLRQADRTAASGVQVYADPAGHPFCICWLPER